MERDNAMYDGFDVDKKHIRVNRNETQHFYGKLYFTPWM